MAKTRVATLSRKTAETDITVKLAVDGKGAAKVDTGIPFFDHMLTLFAKHGLFDLEVKARGDVAVDYHHTVEDVGLVLGEAFKAAIGDKVGLKRYGFFILLALLFTHVLDMILLPLMNGFILLLKLIFNI